MKRGLPVDCGNGASQSMVDILLCEGDSDRHRLVLRMHLSNALDLDTGGSLWHAGLAGSQHLLQHPELVRGKSVLEIGGGCGMFGMAAAIAGARRVVITDIDSQVPVIQRNIDQNLHLWSDCETSVTCRSYYFGDELPPQEEFDLIIAADVGFDLELQQALFQTLKNFTASFAHSRALANIESCGLILIEEVRWKDIYDWYIQGMTDAFIEACNCYEKHRQIASHDLSHLRLNHSVAAEDGGLAIHVPTCGCNCAIDLVSAASGINKLSPIILTEMYMAS